MQPAWDLFLRIPDNFCHSLKTVCFHWASGSIGTITMSATFSAVLNSVLSYPAVSIMRISATSAIFVILALMSP